MSNVNFRHARSTFSMKGGILVLTTSLSKNFTQRWKSKASCQKDSYAFQVPCKQSKNLPPHIQHNQPSYDTRANDLEFMDPMLDRAFDYSDQFDRSNGILIHLNRGPIKH